VSLRARLIAASCLVALVALVSAGVATYALFSSSQLRQIDDSLQRSHEPIEQAVDQGGADLQRSIEQVAPGLFVALLDPSGDVQLAIPAREPGHKPVIADMTEMTELTLPADVSGRDLPDVPTFSTQRSTDGIADIRLRTSRLADGSILVVGLSLHESQESRRHLIIIEAIVAAAALLVAGLIAWALVNIGLRPLRRVEQTALLIAAGGDLDQEVPGADDSTEVGRLAGALNTMLDRIRQAFTKRDETEQALRSSEEQMRRFVADVSHELRTPLAAVTAYTELFERGARDRPEDLERALRGIALESERMRELVEELLLLAHLDEGRPLMRAHVDLNEVVVDAMTAARAVSPEWPINLRVRDVVIVDGDSSRLRQVVDNLLANVRTHTPAGTSTSIELQIDDADGVMTISDNGPGMSAEQAEHVFERFFRVDPSRSRSSGGAGLGMAIVHALVTAHGGTIRLHTAPGKGVTIVIRLPLAPLQTAVGAVR